MQYAFRLRGGDDLLLAVKGFAAEKGIGAAYVACCVGCVKAWRLRGADGQAVFVGEERAEIVSLCGTVSEGGAHLHIALAREDLSVFGGHLLEGCVVNTTAEVVLQAVAGVRFTRAFDTDTGYRELEIEALTDGAHG